VVSVSLVLTEGASVLARSSSILHPGGARIATPLLVPSFSSRGFGKGRNGKAVVRSYFALMKDFLTESYLISTFDLHHRILPVPRSATTELVIVDSGGYESGVVDDLSAYTETSSSAAAWKKGHHAAVLARWPTRIPALLVSFDRYGTVANQLKAARKQALMYPEQLHAFLWKPLHRGGDYLDPELLRPVVSQIADFAVLGVTEKELGGTIPKRLAVLSALRRFLDSQGVNTPIHVFGGLDPLSVTLYFLAGAEIFDGLTWLRYGFDKGLAVYKENSYTMSGGPDAYESRRAKLIADNYFTFTLLEQALRAFLSNRDLTTITPHPDVVRREMAAIGVLGL
jgi:hypothetical protein